jgi:hypothetical protein
MTMKKLLKLFEQEAPAAPAAPAQNFGQAFAAGRKAALAGGSKTFKWTDPKTGKEGTYGTNLKKPAAASSTAPQAVNNQSSTYGAQNQAQAPTISDRAATDPAVAGTSTQPATNTGTTERPLAFNQAAGSSPGTPEAPATAPITNSPFGKYAQSAVGQTVTTEPAAQAAKPAAAPVTPIADFSKPTMTAGNQQPAQSAEPTKTYGAGYDPSKTQYAYSGGQAAKPAVDTAVKGGFGQPTNVVTDTPDDIAKRGPMGIRLPEAELEEDNELSELMRLSGQPMQEKAPPGAKAERMVKHIKKGYSKDSKLTPKEKSIAYATAWKAHNKSEVTESVVLEAGSTLEHIIKKFKHETKNFLAGQDLDSDLYEALYDYYSDAGEMPYGVAKARDGDPYQWVGDRFADEMQMHGYGRQTDMLGGNHELTELARLAGLSESQVSECGDMDTEQQDSMNVSTNMSSDGTKSVSISAQGDQADALLQMLKMAGMRPHDNDNSMGMTEPEVIMVGGSKDEMMDEEYANEPEEEYQTIDSIIHQGDDLNREKEQHPVAGFTGDNPMAEEMSLDEELQDLLDSILVREEMTDVLKAEQPYKDEKTGKMVTPPKGATMPPPDSQYAPGDKRNMMPPKRK